MTDQIIYLKHHQIDKVKWDECVQADNRKLVYALSWYLDIVSPGWEALVVDDYKIIFPLTVKKKLGIPYLVKPNHVQAHCLIGPDIEPHLEELFFKRIHKQFIYSNLQLYTANGCKKEAFCGKVFSNYVLGLNKPYPELFLNFNKNNKKNIRSARNKDLHIEKWDNFSTFIDFTKNVLEDKSVMLQDRYWQEMDTLIRALSDRGMCHFYAVYKEDQLCSLTGIIEFQNRFYLLYNSQTDLGRKLRAHYYALDFFIEKHAGTDAVLDFEGSSIPSIAYFFEGFGAEKEFFYSFRHCRFSILLRLIKSRK